MLTCRPSPPARAQGFEVVKAVHLEAQQFSVEEDTMTPSFKLKRVPLQRKYQAVINALYAEVRRVVACAQALRAQGLGWGALHVQRVRNGGGWCLSAGPGPLCGCGAGWGCVLPVRCWWVQAILEGGEFGQMCGRWSVCAGCGTTQACYAPGLLLQHA